VDNELKIQPQYTIRGVLFDFDLYGHIVEECLRTIDPDALSGSLIVALPGEPTEHNADEVLADGRLSWEVVLSARSPAWRRTSTC